MKSKKWIKSRHKIIRDTAYWILYPYCKIKYGITIEKFKNQGNRPYLILLNHQTPFDQFFAGMAFKGPVYYLATEDIFSNGFISSIIRWLVAPIPIKKQTTDVGAVMNCMRIAREGGTICIAPEGNRTYSGKTEYMNPAIAALVKKLRLPVAFFRIEGGYGTQPRWSDCIRKGKMHGFVSRVLEPEEIAEITNEQLFEIIENELYVNEAVADGVFKSKKKAEYLERAVFWCPLCGFSKFESSGNIIKCSSCERRITYNENKTLEGIGFEFPFKFVNDWYEAQCRAVNNYDPDENLVHPLFDDKASMYEVIIKKKKRPLVKDATVSLFGDRITVNDRVFAFSDITAAAVLGRNKLNIYHGDKVYQFKGNKRFNALKYVNFYHRKKNILKGEENGEFLGL